MQAMAILLCPLIFSQLLNPQQSARSYLERRLKVDVLRHVLLEVEQCRAAVHAQLVARVLQALDYARRALRSHPHTQ
jgi:hypothetical protein